MEAQHRFWRPSCFYSILAALLVCSSHATVAQGGTIALVQNWSVSSPTFSNADLAGMIFPTDPGPGVLPIPLSIDFVDFQSRAPVSFTFTNSYKKNDYIGPPTNGSLTASVNAYSRFLVDLTVLNSTGSLWTSFIFDIKDNIPGRDPVDGSTNHPAPAHFHASKGGAFETSMAPSFTVLTRVPVPDDKAQGNGTARLIASGGTGVMSGDPWVTSGLSMHDNITFDANGDSNTSFTLTLTPVPEPSSAILMGIGGLLMCGLRAARRSNRVHA